MATISMDVVQYDALVVAAMEGDIESVRALDMRIRSLAGVTQFRLWVRWLEVGGAPAPRVSPIDWPNTQKAEIVLDRAIERADVDLLLQNRSINATDVHVTLDPDGQVGWYAVDAFRFEP
jgi:hypothetical protein